MSPKGYLSYGGVLVLEINLAIYAHVLLIWGFGLNCKWGVVSLPPTYN